MAAFSRLQLAAALLGWYAIIDFLSIAFFFYFSTEYDNDPDNPESFRSAKDSAIFSHLRRGKARINNINSISTDRLGASIYNDASSVNSGSAGANRKSLASVEAFRSIAD